MLPEIPESLERNGTQSALHAVRGSFSRPGPGIERLQNRDSHKPRERRAKPNEAIGRANRRDLGILSRPQSERFSLGGRTESKKIEAGPSPADFHSDPDENKIYGTP